MRVRARRERLLRAGQKKDRAARDGEQKGAGRRILIY